MVSECLGRNSCSIYACYKVLSPYSSLTLLCCWSGRLSHLHVRLMISLIKQTNLQKLDLLFPCSVEAVIWISRHAILKAVFCDLPFNWSLYLGAVFRVEWELHREIEEWMINFSDTARLRGWWNTLRWLRVEYQKLTCKRF